MMVSNFFCGPFFSCKMLGFREGWLAQTTRAPLPLHFAGSFHLTGCPLPQPSPQVLSPKMAYLPSWTMNTTRHLWVAILLEFWVEWWLSVLKKLNQRTIMQGSFHGGRFAHVFANLIRYLSTSGPLRLARCPADVTTIRQHNTLRRASKPSPIW